MKSKSSKQPSNNQGGNKEGPIDESTLLGQILVELGYITIYQLDEALHIQRTDAERGKEHKELGRILLELGYCTPNQLLRACDVQCEYRNTSPAK